VEFVVYMKLYLYKKVYIFFFLGLILFPVYVPAQEKTPILKTTSTYQDSLKRVFQRTEELQKLIKIVRKSIHIFDDEQKIKIEESKELLDYFLAETIAKRKVSKILPYIQNALAFIYYENPVASMIASDYFLNSLTTIEAESDLEWQSRTYQYLGTLLYYSEEYEGAVKYFSKFVRNVKRIKVNQGLIISSYNTLALIFQKQELIDSALFYYEKGLAEAFLQKHRFWEGLLKGNIGTIRHKQKRYEEALTLLDKDVEISLEYKEFGNALQSLTQIIQIHLDQKNYQIAKKRLEQADTLILKVARRPIDLRAYISFYEVSAIYFEAVGSFKESLRYRRLYEETDQEYRKYIKDIEIQRIKYRYDYEAKKNDIEKLTEKTEKQQTYLYVVIFILITVILSIIILIQRFYQKKILMTRLKAQHKQIQQYNTELLQSVEQITFQAEVIEKQNQELKASNLSKDKMFTLISHDLRSPLAGLKGVVSSIKLDVLTMEDLQEILPIIENNLDTTLNLTEELLYWAKSQMEGMQANPSLLHPHTIIQQMIANLHKIAEVKGIKLVAGDVSELLTVWADENMIKAVLRNLVSNAIKFCESEASITIAATAKDEHTVLFTVKDTGTGIKPELLEKIFKNEPLTTLGTAKEKGSGFGLMMCKDFITQNGGEIGVNSVWEEGSEFYFTLPSKQVI
jgi:signal transduction histidine kinase